MILVHKIVNCKLSIERVVSGEKDLFVCEGKGYYKDDNGEIVIFFSSEDVKYKYVLNNNELVVFCNDSKYVFRENEKNTGEIKNGDYIFKITIWVDSVIMYFSTAT